MAEFTDLSPYSYFDRYDRPGTQNIGWMDVTKPFLAAQPTERLLDLLFEYCKVSVALCRGAHFCEMCGADRQFLGVERNGERLFLGMAEIRVFSENGVIFAAPNLIYHYVAEHLYAPPRAFVDAILTTPSPPSREYFLQLEKADLEWTETRRVT